MLSRQHASRAAYRGLLTHALERGVEELFLPQTLEQVPLWDGVEAAADEGAPAVELPLTGDAAPWAGLRSFRADHFSNLPAEPVANRAGVDLRFTPLCVCRDAADFLRDAAEVWRLRHLRARPAAITVEARYDGDGCNHFPGDGFFPSDFVDSIHSALAHLEGATRVCVFACGVEAWDVPLHLADCCCMCVQEVDLSGVTDGDRETLERCFQPLEYTHGRFQAAWREWAGPTAAEGRACRSSRRGGVPSGPRSASRRARRSPRRRRARRWPSFPLPPPRFFKQRGRLRPVTHGSEGGSGLLSLRRARCCEAACARRRHNDDARPSARVTARSRPSRDSEAFKIRG